MTDSAFFPLPWRDVLGALSISLARGGQGPSPEPVLVYTAANQFEADVVSGRLEVEGIPSWKRRETLGAAYGLIIGPLARVDILVPAVLADRARDILAAVEENTDEDEG